MTDKMRIYNFLEKFGSRFVLGARTKTDSCFIHGAVLSNFDKDNIGTDKDVYKIAVRNKETEEIVEIPEHEIIDIYPETRDIKYRYFAAENLKDDFDIKTIWAVKIREEKKTDFGKSYQDYLNEVDVLQISFIDYANYEDFLRSTFTSEQTINDFIEAGKHPIVYMSERPFLVINRGITPKSACTRYEKYSTTMTVEKTHRYYFVAHTFYSSKPMLEAWPIDLIGYDRPKAEHIDVCAHSGVDSPHKEPQIISKDSNGFMSEHVYFNSFDSVSQFVAHRETLEGKKEVFNFKAEEKIKDLSKLINDLQDRQTEVMSYKTIEEYDRWRWNFESYL